MAYISVGKENSTSVDLYYEDHGAGRPVVLIHGYPLSGASWEKQTAVLLKNGYRVITYDRRGFGKSSQPVVGYNYDTLADDLGVLLSHLKLDQDVTLVGFSMGGGEVARYIGKHGTKGIAGAVFISAVTPYLVKTADNPEGVDRGVFEKIKQSVTADRYAFLTAFFQDFFNADALIGTLVTQQVITACWNIAAGASPKASVDCVDAWLEDFRKDLKRIDVPTLVIHGDDDRTLPVATTGARTSKLIPHALSVVIKGGPHCITWTHAEEVNRSLLSFLGGGK